MPVTVIEKGSMFDSNCDMLVNPVNCIGVMGGGLALVFARKFPKMVAEYKEKCDSGELRPGKMHIYEPKEAPVVCNFPTKDDLSPSQLKYVVDGLEELRRVLDARREIRSVAMPALGCGLGGLKWDEVKPLIEFAFKDWDGEVKLYAPQD